MSGYSTATPRACTTISPLITSAPVNRTEPLASKSPPFRKPLSSGNEKRSPWKTTGPLMFEAITRGLRITTSASVNSIVPWSPGASGVPVIHTSMTTEPSTDICGDSTDSGRRPGVPVIHTFRAVASPKITLPPIRTGTPAPNSTSSNDSTPPAIDR